MVPKCTGDVYCVTSSWGPNTTEVRGVVCEANTFTLKTRIQRSQRASNGHGKIHMQMLYSKSGSSSGVTGASEGGLTLTPPTSKSKFLYGIFHMMCSKECPVAFQWPVQFPVSIIHPIVPSPPFHSLSRIPAQSTPSCSPR